MRSTLCFTAIVGISLPACCQDSQSAPAESERYSRRWVFMHPGFDLRQDDQADEMLAVIERIGKAGYTGVSVPTRRLRLLTWKQPDNYYRNMERVRVAAEEAGLELIPRVMGFNGYANGMLSNNPNLAEDANFAGYHVIDAYTKEVVAAHLFEYEGNITRGPHGIGVSPDGKWLLYTQPDQLNSDILMVEAHR